MKKEELNAIAERWEGVTKGFKNLTFEEAKADMEMLLAALRATDRLSFRIAELESHIRKRNSDFQQFVAEVGHLAMQKYGDWSEQPPKAAPSAGRAAPEGGKP